MRTYVYYVLAIAAAVGGMGYVRGWFGPPRPTNTVVRVEYIDNDGERVAFGNTIDTKAKAIKGQFAMFDQKSEGLAGDTKIQMQKKLADLKMAHIRLEEQIKELGNSASEKYETNKEQLSKSLAEVEKQIEEFKVKLNKQPGA